MRGLIVILCISLIGCTITIAPIPKKPVKKQYAKHKKTKTSQVVSQPNNNSWLIVDSGWLMQYRALEEQHGNYTLHDDSKVEAVGGGKYKVTHAMMDHFRDLTVAPVATPTP